MVSVKDDESGLEGWGECCVLPGLSVDEEEDYENYDASLLDSLNDINLSNSTEILNGIQEYIPSEHRSMQMALETALLDLSQGGTRKIFEGPFYEGEEELLINGLIWMGHSEFMLQQVSQKIYDGFKTIKMKIGGMDFDMECDILDYIRRRYYKDDITIRLDANGSFSPKDALHKLERLSKYDIHSMEQPVPPGTPEMASIIKESSIPIALDEELIGIRDFDSKADLLSTLNPHYLILKPSLLGGFHSTNEWLQLAEAKGMEWWVTSALESNVGLNAIAQFTAQYNNPLPQGLGTGKLYENNFPSPLKLKGERLSYLQNKTWDIGNFE